MGKIKNFISKRFFQIVILFIFLVIWIYRMTDKPCGEAPNVFKRIKESSDEEIRSYPCKKYPDKRTVD